MRRRLALFAVLLVATAAVAVPVVRGADVLVGKRSPAGKRVGFDQIDHAAWDDLLRRFVNERGEVDYAGWQASAEASAKLDGYLDTLATLDPNRQATRESELAYWINAYNAVTVKGILREYPTTSIRNHTAAVWGYNLWKNLKLRYADTQINLDDIEHQVLRKRGEPRIHFAIVCASIGCPRLLNEAYVVERLNEQLDTNARHFFAQDQNFQIDASANTVRLSAILNWFGEDFGDSKPAILERIKPWLPTDDAREFVSRTDVKVKHLKYDWNLNEQ
ncbi:MAG: DUF547 domain-containing protein [Planctomycetota bacterium]